MEFERRYDVILYGASGLTGKLVLEELIVIAEQEKISFSVAGRSASRLEKVLREVAKRTERNVVDISIIVADVNDAEALENMAKQTKLVMNCVGPYRFYGEAVVKACIAQGAHHIDVSGEPSFLENMQLKHNKAAQENKVCVIGSCGFDSMAAEAGYLYLCDKFKDGQLCSIETFFGLHSGVTGYYINLPTLESAIHDLNNYKDLLVQREKLYTIPLPEPEHKLEKKPSVFYNSDVKHWCGPWLGSDKAVVRRTLHTQINSGEIDTAIDFRAHVTISNRVKAYAFLLLIYFVAFLCKFQLGRWLILSYPWFFTFGLFTKTGPTREQMGSSTFTMDYVGLGFDSKNMKKAGAKPNRKILARMTGPDPYMMTARTFCQAAMVVLKEFDNMAHKYGVFPAGAAFRTTTLLDRMNRRAVKVSTISDTLLNSQ